MGKLEELGQEAVEELRRAEEKFPGFNSAHEGYAVLLEEVDELWDVVKLNPKKIEISTQELRSIGSLPAAVGQLPDKEEIQRRLSKIQKPKHRKMMRDEAMQVAAMGLRFMKFLDEQED